MRRHSFDPLSAVLGIITITAGVLVAIDRIELFDGDTGWWIAVAALALGVALIPWGWRRSGLTALTSDETDQIEPDVETSDDVVR